MDRIDGADTKQPQSLSSENGIPYFSSKTDLKNAIEKLKVGKIAFDKDGWISLEDGIRERKLQQFSNATLKAANINPENILIEDSLIYDSQVMKVVNQFREVQIGDDIFKITDLGVFRCTDSSILKLRELVDDPKFRQKVIVLAQNYHNTTKEKLDKNLKSAEDVDYEVYDVEPGIAYTIPIEPIEANPSPVSTVNIAQQNQPPSSTPTADMEMCDESSKTWVGELLAGVLGYSVECHNYFRSDVRVKTVFWSQNYIIYKSIGVKVKLQNRALGIWWAEKADELKIGWEKVVYKTSYTLNPISINVSYNGNQYFTPPNLYTAFISDQYKKWENDVWEGNKTPINFSKLIWFMDIPSEINKYIYEFSVPQLRNSVKSIIKSLNGPNTDNLALQIVQPNDITMVYLPQDPALHTYNDNKAEVEFDRVNGTFILGNSSQTIQGLVSPVNLSSINPILFIKEAPVDFNIQKGSKVYGIVKWGGEWRGSYIYKN